MDSVDIKFGVKSKYSTEQLKHYYDFYRENASNYPTDQATIDAYIEKNKGEKIGDNATTAIDNRSRLSKLTVQITNGGPENTRFREEHGFVQIDIERLSQGRNIGKRHSKEMVQHYYQFYKTNAHLYPSDKATAEAYVNEYKGRRLTTGDKVIENIDALTTMGGKFTDDSPQGSIYRIGNEITRINLDPLIANRYPAHKS